MLNSINNILIKIRAFIINKKRTILVFGSMGILCLVIYGFTLKFLWNWFIAGTGVGHITFLEALGIGLFINLIYPHEFKSSGKKITIIIYETLLFKCFTPIFLLLLGFLLQLFI